MLTISDKDGPLGTIRLDGDRLIASTRGLQDTADTVIRRTGSAEAAYAEIRDRSNGYTWAREAP